MIAAEAPLAQYFDTDGTPLTSGYLYFGTANQNPETSPITVYWDAAGTQPAAQPIRTLNGYTVRNGMAAVVFGPSDYSMTIRNSKGVMLLYVASAAAVSNGAINATALAQLAADLANNNTVGKGADQVGLNLTGTGEVDTSLGPYLNLKVKGFKANFGCALDGVTDDYARAANALTSAGKIIELEAGTLLTQSALPVPTCAEIRGWSPTVSKIQIGSAVTGQAIDATAFLRLRDFKVLGAGVAGVGGVYYGKSAIWYGESHNIRCEGFTGSGSWGMRLGDAQKCMIVHPYLDGNYDNFRIDRTSPAFPTSTLILKPICVNAQNLGWDVLDADTIEIVGAVMDSNKGGAVRLKARSGGAITGLHWIRPRFEDNAATQLLTETDGTNRFQFYAGDGTGLGGATIRFVLDHPFFAPGGAAARSILLNGSAVAGAEILGPDVPNSAQISVINGAYWRSDDWLPSLDYRTVVYDPSGLDTGLYGPSKDMTGLTSIGSESGNAAVTFASGPSVNLARYKAEGRWIDLQLDISGTLNAVTPRYFTVALPAGFTIARSIGEGCRVSDAGASVAGWLELDAASNTVRFWRADGAAFTSGGAVSLRGRIRGELT